MIKESIALFVAATTLSATNINLNGFFNKEVCDQVLTNKGYFKTCYDYKAKGAKYVAYTLNGDLINVKNIKKRPRFYEDKNIPKRYRSTYKDYTHNKFKMDRGHLYPDAAADDNYQKLHSVYAMSNIIPQYKTINRGKKYWAGVERYARHMATKLRSVNVLNGVEYDKKPHRIGHNQIAVPKAFWKIIYNTKEKFEKCFYFENNPLYVKGKNSIKDFIVDCNKLLQKKIGR